MTFNLLRKKVTLTKLNIAEKIYNQIIYQETGSLIATSCEAGAPSVHADETTA